MGLNTPILKDLLRRDYEDLKIRGVYMKKRKKKKRYSNINEFFSLYLFFQKEKDETTKLKIAFEMFKFDLEIIIKNGEQAQTLFMDALVYAVSKGKEKWIELGYTEELFQDAFEGCMQLIK
jgi:hypothetical protein